jgi:hypothetical protein
LRTRTYTDQVIRVPGARTSPGTVYRVSRVTPKYGRAPPVIETANSSALVSGRIHVHWTVAPSPTEPFAGATGIGAGATVRRGVSVGSAGTAVGVGAAGWGTGVLDGASVGDGDGARVAVGGGGRVGTRVLVG